MSSSLTCLSGNHMMTSSNGNIFRVTGPLCGEFTGPDEFPAQRPVTLSFDVFFDLRLNKRLSEQPWGWWFETLSWSLWRHRNAHTVAHSNSLSTRVIWWSMLRDVMTWARHGWRECDVTVMCGVFNCGLVAIISRHVNGIYASNVAI